jgi:hypothetical protein
MTQYKNLNEVKIQVDETTQIMKNNIEKVLERDEKLGELVTKSEVLVEGSQRFQKKTNKLKWKMYCADKRFLAGIIIVLLFLVLILVIILSKK